MVRNHNYTNYMILKKNIDTTETSFNKLLSYLIVLNIYNNELLHIIKPILLDKYIYFYAIETILNQNIHPSYIDRSISYNILLKFMIFVSLCMIQYIVYIIVMRIDLLFTILYLY